jgi:hypothetical protein
VRDRQLLLAEQEYAGTREMLRRVGVLAIVGSEAGAYYVLKGGKKR